MRLSIIIPVYNMEKHLEGCLISVLDQDIPYEDYEVICVDDGSSDKSPEILDRYAAEYANVRVIHQKNAGHAMARQRGMEMACGQYFWFIDSDDFIDTNCLGYILRLIENQALDLLTINCVSVETNARYTHRENQFQPEKQYDYLEDRACSGIKIFRAEIIRAHQIHWEDLSPCDDIAFVFMFQLYAQKQTYIKNVNYYHRGGGYQQQQKQKTVFAQYGVVYPLSRNLQERNRKAWG